ncbi:hypothetical protein GDO86_000226 [Hymenochirus boettgeri]|uniref:BOD1/SHG1 domain-containing protein n=1 Tax=Hymenochirus boettgeri TaxID=247094 RepID=A0A8T2KGL2_9PIPI|nr:hypothetical protein GDO86_000226 [Hymenochirus boettgeri]
MADMQPGDPKLVSQIVNHLKSQGLFDQFRRDCLADVDTKPAYQNLRQRVDSFVANHLASHTWSPHLNKNQLRNNIRQQVLKSGMLESGIDRIISQVVDPKINHIFRPQVEKVVQEYLAMLNSKEDAKVNTEQHEERSESSNSVHGSLSAVGSSTNVASDAMSILETISSLNQEATAARALIDGTNHKNTDKGTKKFQGQQCGDLSIEKECSLEEIQVVEKLIPETLLEEPEPAIKIEETHEVLSPAEAVKNLDMVVSTQSKDTESEEQKPKIVEKSEKKNGEPEKTEKKEMKSEKKNENVKKVDEGAIKGKEEKAVKDQEKAVKDQENEVEKNNNKQKAAGTIHEDNLSIDSDIDDYTDVTVSSVHTSDLSSFDEESEEEAVLSDSTEEGEITTGDEDDKADSQSSKPKTDPDQTDAKAKSTRHSYVHKPYLYSKYYSDSDDETAVEQHRQSVAKEKEERLLRRQVKRERLEEKRKQKAAEKLKNIKINSQRTGKLGIEQKSNKSIKPKSSSIKEALKEQMFLEKKVARSKTKKEESRLEKNISKPKSEFLEQEVKDAQKSDESLTIEDQRPLHSGSSVLSIPEPHDQSMYSQRASTWTDCAAAGMERTLLRNGEELTSTQSQEALGWRRAHRSWMKRAHSDNTKPCRLTSESTEEFKSEIRLEKENKKKTQQESERESQRQRSGHKSDKYMKKEIHDSETPATKMAQKKDSKLYQSERERSSSKDDKSSSKYRQKADTINKTNDDSDLQKSKKIVKDEDNSHKRFQSKSSSEERSDRKSKHKSEGKSSTYNKEDKISGNENVKISEKLHRESSKRDRHISDENPKLEHRYKRSSSDSKAHRESHNDSKQSSSQKKSKTATENKSESDSSHTNSSKQGESTHKDKRRSYSSSEDRSSKAKFKSSSKSKLGDQEDTTQKSDKEKTDNYLEKHHKLKPEDNEQNKDTLLQSSNSLAKENSSKSKHSSDKEKEKSRADSRERSSKQDRKPIGETLKGTSSKHSHKDFKRKVDTSKSDERVLKPTDDKRAQERSSIDKKTSRKNSLETRGESSKGSLSSRKGSKLESEQDGSVHAGGKPSNSRSTSKMTVETGTEIAEPAGIEPLSLLNNLHANSLSESGATNTDKDAKKNQEKQDLEHRLGENNLVPTGYSRNDSTANGNEHIYLFTQSPGNALQELPFSRGTIVTASTSVDSTNYSDASYIANSGDSSSSCLIVDEQRRPELEQNASIRFSLSSPGRSVDISQSNDVISTTEICDTELKGTVKEFTSSSVATLVLDSTVTGNDIEMEDTNMSKDHSVSTAENAAFTESSTDSTTVETSSEGDSTFLLKVDDGKQASSSFRGNGINTFECENTATSSCSTMGVTEIIRGTIIYTTSSGDNAATSTNTRLDNVDANNSENDLVFENSGEYTATTSAGNSVEEDISMLSENSFEDATASSSTTITCSSEKKHENTASSSQETIGASLEDEAVGNIRLNPASSSNCNAASSGSALKNSATSSNSETIGTGNLVEFTQNIMRHAATSSFVNVTDNDGVSSDDAIIFAATSSDNAGENEGPRLFSENDATHAATSSDTASPNNPLSQNTVMHAASSSDNIIENHSTSNVMHAATSSDHTAKFISKNLTSEEVGVITHASTSSDISVNRNGALQGSEGILVNTATSSDSTAEMNAAFSMDILAVAASSSVIDSSRRLNFEGSVVSSGNDSDNTAASSSNLIDNGVAERSATWVQNSVERVNSEDMASSSSTSVTHSRLKHTTVQFHNVEESKKSSATSSTQQDGGLNILSSVTHMVNSSDLDSNSDVCISAVSEIDSCDAASCSSTGSEQSPEDNTNVAHQKVGENTATSSSALHLNTGDMHLCPEVPSQNGNEEAASSSSSCMGSSERHLLHKSSLGPDNIDVAASSSIAIDSNSESMENSLLCPGNSVDNAASSSSNITDHERTYVNVNNTQATTSSSITMDSSTGEESEIKFILDTEKTSTATSSSTLINCLSRAEEIGTCVEQDRVAASSSISVENCTKEATISPDKGNENAATSSNIVYSKKENKTCNTISDINSATTSTTNIQRLAANDNFRLCCEANSEATAASSSAMESSDNISENATSSNYVMAHVSQTTQQDRNDEAASSSGMSSGTRHQAIKPEMAVDSRSIEDATTSSSTERGVNVFPSVRVEDASNNESAESINETVESSFAASRSDRATPGTSGETLTPQSGTSANNEDVHPLIHSDDGANLNYERSNEKEDAVSSASSEEHKICSNGARQSAIEARDGEVDGAVTSAGAIVSESSMITENSNVFDHVTCANSVTMIDDRNVISDFATEEMPVYHSSRASQREESQVTETVVEDAEDNSCSENVNNAASTGTDDESETLMNQSALEEGEGTVTSTGITEENYRRKERQELREGSCSGAETEHSGNMLSRQEMADCVAITEDDESAITSTGAKEDEEEGEGFVTSTGTASEDSSFSTGADENSSSALIIKGENNREHLVPSMDEKMQKDELTEAMVENVMSFSNVQESSLSMANNHTDENDHPQSPCIEVEGTLSVTNNDGAECSIISVPEQVKCTSEMHSHNSENTKRLVEEENHDCTQTSINNMPAAALESPSTAANELFTGSPVPISEESVNAHNAGTVVKDTPSLKVVSKEVCLNSNPAMGNSVPVLSEHQSQETENSSSLSICENLSCNAEPQSGQSNEDGGSQLVFLNKSKSSNMSHKPGPCSGCDDSARGKTFDEISVAFPEKGALKEESQKCKSDTKEDPSETITDHKNSESIQELGLPSVTDELRSEIQQTGSRAEEDLSGCENSLVKEQSKEDSSAKENVNSDTPSTEVLQTVS